jgi:hypothetical protein
MEFPISPEQLSVELELSMDLVEELKLAGLPCARSTDGTWWISSAGQFE